MNIRAYGKLNLILNVLGKRPDGYHEIETLMTTAPIFDDLEINVSKGNGIWINATGLSVNCGPANLAYKAAQLMKAEFDKTGHVVIDLDKNIPVAGGLGGGSCDAAAVVFALSRIWEIDDEARLYSVANGLGSDVAFCLGTLVGHRAAIGRGRGEILEFVDIPNLNVELKTLDIHVRNKTVEVYKELRPQDYQQPFSIEKFLAACGSVGGVDGSALNGLLGNHLEAPAARVFARHGHVLPLNEGGAQYHLSGAGPTLFRLL